MRQARPPFAWVDGQPYLVVNWDVEPSELPPLPDLLEHLLAGPAKRDVLLLRPLARAEARHLHGVLTPAVIEAWARIVARPADRFRPRPRRWAGWAQTRPAQPPPAPPVPPRRGRRRPA
jgi:hypothetical protein